MRSMYTVQKPGYLPRSHFSFDVKNRNGKRWQKKCDFFLLFADVNKICHFRGKFNLWTCNLQIGRPKISYNTVKQFPFNLPYPNGKKIHICNWISFAISNFVIIEKMASGCLVILWLKSKIGLISYYLYKMIKFAPFLT